MALYQGYKGKKQGDVQYSSYQRNGKDGCLVTQVQLDAWLYINRHKLSKNKQPKPPISDVDHDYRVCKELNINSFFETAAWISNIVSVYLSVTYAVKTDGCCIL